MRACMQGKYLAADGGPSGARLNRYRGALCRGGITVRAQAQRAGGGGRPMPPLAAEAGMSPVALAIRSARMPARCNL